MARGIACHSPKVVWRLILDSGKRNDFYKAKSNEDFGSLQKKYLMQCWAAQRHYDPIAVERADGCWIHTTDGKKIFD